MGSLKQLLDLRKGNVLSGKVFPLSAIAVEFHSVSWEICQHSILRASLLGATTGLFDGAVSENVKAAWRDM